MFIKIVKALMIASFIFAIISYVVIGLLEFTNINSDIATIITYLISGTISILIIYKNYKDI